VGESPTAYRDRWAARGGAHVPGCFLFMRGVLDPAETGPHWRKKGANRDATVARIAEGPIPQSGRSPRRVRRPTVSA
jgi:hypothetical protein